MSDGLRPGTRTMCLEEYLLPELPSMNGIGCVDEYLGRLAEAGVSVDMEIFEPTTEGFAMVQDAMGQEDGPVERSVWRRALERDSVLVLTARPAAFSAAFGANMEHVATKENLPTSAQFLPLSIQLDQSRILKRTGRAVLVCHDGEPVYLVTLNEPRVRQPSRSDDGI